VFENIKVTMNEGKADFTKESVAELKKIAGVEEITVINAEGGEAFKPGSPTTESSVMDRFRAGKEYILKKDQSRLTYYLPLQNASECQKCHGGDKPLLGAVKIAVSVEQAYKTAMNRIILMVLAIMFLSACFSVLLWFVLRKMVISPIKALESAAEKIAEGDISFNVDVRSDDELGRLSRMLKGSSRTLGSIFARIRGLSVRIARVAEDIEREADHVVKGAEVETEAVVNISHSVEELNATATEITENIVGLAASAEETSASMEEMASSIGSVNSSIHDLSSAVEATSSSIEELSATIREVAGNAEELASASDETLSAVSEITAAVKEVERNAKESARQSERVTSDAATLGMTSIEKTIEGMRKIKVSVERSDDLIRKLGDRSDEIGKILTVIDDVTDQTTLLALNAAILAAQAGEHGKGFSVVAEEIKDLAERTAFSTQEIASLIQSVQLEVKNAVDAMREGLLSVDDGLRLSKEAGGALQKVLESAKQSSEMSRTIERSTTEQAKAANLVAAAMERIRNGASQIANATAEQSKGAVLIMKATEKMKEVSRQVGKAAEEQTISSKQISSAMDVVAERTAQMSRSLSEHRIGSQGILNTVEGVKGIPVENRKMAFNIGNTIRDLQKDSELLKMEMERFKFYEEKNAGALVKFGVLPVESPAVMFRKFSPLVDYLGRKMGRTMELKVAIDFESALNDIGHKLTHVCTLGPTTYVEAHKMYGVSLIVKGLRDGKPYHRAAIFTRASSDIKSINDLKGRSFAFGDVKSASGHVAPRLMLKDAGIELDDLKYCHYFGYHDEAARAVLKGDFDAGAVIESFALQHRDRGLRIVAFSDEIPEWNICSSNVLEERDVLLLKNALLSLNGSTAEDNAILKSVDEHYTGFVEAQDRDYDGIRTKMQRLGMI
ncbi:MAG: phosphate/phosphite/phosphonate ABC transporter substrate-binding protein, partial [Thermodesulfovibrionales bacterium]